MKSEQEIRAKLAAVDADERFHYPSATVFENAPLAIIQACLESQAELLTWILGVAPLKKRRRKERK